jgi:RNA polymerase sigma-32 factor
MSHQAILFSPNKELTGGIQSYLNYVNSQPVLSRDEERTLFTEYRENNNLSAVKQIILSHLRFVAYIAKSYTGYGLPLEDLVQEGTLGLMKSVKQFDPNKGVRLASFAVYWIKSGIHEYVLKNWKLVKVATTKAQRKLFFNLRKLKKQTGWISNEDTKEIAEYLGVPEREVREMDARLSQQDCFFDTTFGETVDEEGPSNLAISKYLEDEKTNPETLLLEHDNKNNTLARLHQALSELDKRSLDIIQSRWMASDDQKLGLKALSQKYGVSMERIRQLEVKAINTLKLKLNAGADLLA